MIKTETLVIIAFVMLSLIVVPIITYPKAHYIGRDDVPEWTDYSDMYNKLNEACDNICGNQTINGFYCNCGHCNCYCDLNDFKRWRILNNC